MAPIPTAPRTDPAAAPPLAVEAGLLVDGRGRTHRDVRILVADGRVTAVQPRARRVPLEGFTLLGSPDTLVLPGLVNAHQHGRSTSTVALGVPDSPLETWLVGLLGLPPGDLYRESVLAARRLAAGGATTALHFQYTTAATAEDYARELRTIAAAYGDAGIRCVIAADVRDRGEPVYGDTAAFLAALPRPLRAWVSERLPRPLPVAAALEVVADLRRDARAGGLGLADVVLGPPGPPWCSDGVWREVGRAAARDGIPVQTHLQETRDERVQALLEYGRGAAGHLDALGLLSPRLALAHAVWLDDREIELLRRHDVTVVTNPASNLRLHAGVAPVRRYLDEGVNVAVGTDNNGLADDESMLGELRLAQALHRRPRVDDGGIAAADLLGMATGNAARWLDRPELGAVEVGGPADLVLLPRLGADGESALQAAIALQAAGPLTAVVCAGRVVPLHAPDAPSAAGQGEHAAVLRELHPYVVDHYQAAARRALGAFPNDLAVRVSH